MWRRIPPLWILLAATTVLYVWGLGASGWANAYYSAAVQAGAESWRAFFFGSFDAANSITVDKPPLALWPMALSVRIFGLSSWSILLPQALMGVATVAVVYAGVRRATGSVHAALLGGAAFALTPVAVLMFRFNNPDSLLTLLLVSAAVATLRGIQASRHDAGHPVRWLVLGGSLVGLAFLTKMLQAFLVLPAFMLAYLLFAAVPLARRYLHLLAAFGAMLVAGSWWLVVVELWPAGSRPWIGGSQNNSVLELVLGYNGVGRLTGEQTGAVTGPGGWGNATLGRLLDPASGGQASWLLPAALILGITAIVLTRGSRTTAETVTDSPTAEALPDGARPALVLWGTWTVLTFLVFSLMGGIFHDYYTVALAPSVASLLAVSTWVLWHRRGEDVARWALGAALLATGVMAMVVLWPKRDWAPWLPWAVLAVTLVAAWLWLDARRRALPLGARFAVAALVASFAGPAAWSVATVATPHTGAVPHAGPSRPAAAADEAYGAPDPVETPADSSVGDLLTVSTASPQLTRLLTAHAERFTWVAAVTGANSAAGFQLATGRPVMPLGGFNGTDPAPRPLGFRALARDGHVHWFIAGGGKLVSESEPVPSGELTTTGSDDATRIERWVARHFERRVVDGVRLYDLTSPIGEEFPGAAGLRRRADDPTPTRPGPRAPAPADDLSVVTTSAR